MRDQPNKWWLKVVQDYPVVSAVSRMSAEKFVSTAILAGAIYLGATGAFILGAILQLPLALSTLINHATILHLTGHLTLMIFLTVMVFRVSQIAVKGTLFQFNFILCKFYYGRKRTGGIRNPAVVALHRRMNRRLEQKSIQNKILLALQGLVVVLFLGFTFFRFDVVQPIPNYFNVAITTFTVCSIVLGFVGTMMAHNVTNGVSHMDFINTRTGRRLSVSLMLAICSIAGVLRTYSMMYGPTITYSPRGPECQLAPMMPVYGGDLYFDRLSLNFLVISPNGKVFYSPTTFSTEVPKCL